MSKDRTEWVRNQGIENGLFRNCMDAIQTQHEIGQALRDAYVFGSEVVSFTHSIKLLCTCSIELFFTHSIKL